MLDTEKTSSRVRFLQELGPNLIKIVQRLLGNNELLRLLEYTDKDPFSQDKPEVDKKKAYGNGGDGIVRVIPIIPNVDEPQSIIVLRVSQGQNDFQNRETINIRFSIEIFVPKNQWIIADKNLRPYAIMGEVTRSLEGYDVNGLGTITGSGFRSNFFTEEMSAYIMDFTFTQIK